MKKKIRVMIILLISIVIIDQISKILIINFLKEPIGNDYLKLEIVNNTGMAFGFNSGNTKNIFLTIFVLVIVLTFVKNQIERIDMKTTIVIGMVLGGAVSNLVDRIFRKGIIDFIKIYKIPTFNVADIAIVIGWILIIIFLIDYSRKTR